MQTNAGIESSRIHHTHEFSQSTLNLGSIKDQPWFTTQYKCCLTAQYKSRLNLHNFMFGIMFRQPKHSVVVLSPSLSTLPRPAGQPSTQVIAEY